VEDYTLDRFYRVQGEVQLPDGSTIYLRSLSDSEIGIRRKAAVLAARGRREELRDEKGAAFRDFIKPIPDADDGDLVNTIVALSQGDFTREAVEKYPRRHIPYPDDADLDERLEVDDQRDAHWQQVIQDRAKYMEGRSQTHEKAVRDKWTREQRVAKCVDLQKSNQAMSAYLEEDERQLLLLGSFKDKKRKQRYFTSSAMIGELDTRVKTRLRDELNNLSQVDVFAVQGFSSTES